MEMKLDRPKLKSLLSMV